MTEAILNVFGAFILMTLGSWLFRVVPRIMALSILNYRMPWLPLLPFGTGYAAADLALGDSPCMTVIGTDVPAGAVRWHSLISFLLGLFPVIGTVLGLLFRTAAGGPCWAWVLAALEGRPCAEEDLKGHVAALLPTVGTVILIVALARNHIRE